MSSVVTARSPAVMPAGSSLTCTRTLVIRIARNGWPGSAEGWCVRTLAAQPRLWCGLVGEAGSRKARVGTSSGTIVAAEPDSLPPGRRNDEDPSKSGWLTSNRVLTALFLVALLATWAYFLHLMRGFA